MYTTIRRPPEEWCPPTQRYIDEGTKEFAGKPITVDLDSQGFDPECGGRQWAIVSGGIANFVCEHVIVIGD